MKAKENILVTGGAGYIGSHITVALMEAGYDVLVLDDFSNAHPVVMERLERILGRAVPLVRVDMADLDALRNALQGWGLKGVVHCAGLKAVGESVKDPLAYYHHNLGISFNLLQVLDQIGCSVLVFSSSATVYGDPAFLPITETHPLQPTSPYGWTKAMIERVVEDHARSRSMPAISLRYFNPVGAHPSGLIGEDPRGEPNNLVPYITQVASGRRKELSVFGNDWDTPDGTCVRDYIHVMDLAQAHVAAIRNCQNATAVSALPQLNVGTGRGSSVLEMLHAFERVVGRPIPHRYTGRRPGDIAQCWADPAQVQARLGWRAERSFEQMCEDHWRWQYSNPRGYVA